MRYKWTEEEINYLINNYEILTIEQISKKINKSEKSVQTKLGILKKYQFQGKHRQITHTPANTSNWTKEQEKFIIENHNKLSCKEISSLINKRQEDVRLKILSFGLTFKRINKQKNMQIGMIVKLSI